MTDSPFATRASGGSFFKPADHVGDLAIVFEFKKILKDQKHTYNGKESTRDVAYADIACFRNSQDVETATPSLVLDNVAITGQVLVADIERNDWLGKAAVQVIRRVGQPYVYRDVELPGAVEAATKWFLARQEAEADVDIPDFGDDD